MVKYLPFFKHHKIYTALILVSAAFSFASLLITITNYGGLSQSIIVKFDQLKGINIFGEKNTLWGIWLLGFTILGMNGVLMYEFWNRERFLSYLFAAGNGFLALMVFIIITVLLSNN